MTSILLSFPRRSVGRSFAARRGPVSLAKMGLDSSVLPACPAFGLALSPPAALDAPSRPSLLSCDSALRLFALGASFPPPRSIRRPSRTIVSSGLSAGPLLPSWPHDFAFCFLRSGFAVLRRRLFLISLSLDSSRDLLASTSRPDRAFGNLPLGEATFVHSSVRSCFVLAPWLPWPSPACHETRCLVVTARRVLSFRQCISLVSFSFLIPVVLPNVLHLSFLCRVPAVRRSSFVALGLRQSCAFLPSLP